MNSQILRLAILSFLKFVLVCNPAFADKLKVVIDPGHGGQDRGAKFQHFNEADLVLKISEHLVNAINKIQNVKAVRTRTNDQFLPLKQRVKFAKQKNVELFLSIHANAVDPKSKTPGNEKHATGAEFYFLNPIEVDKDDLTGLIGHHHDQDMGSDLDSDVESESLTNDSHSAEVRALVSDLVQQLNIKRSSVLAKSIDKHWSGPRRKKTHAIQQAPFYVLKKASIPSVLIEVGFIDNPNEAKKLSDPAYQKKIANSIALGLKDFLQNNTPHLL